MSNQPLSNSLGLPANLPDQRWQIASAQTEKACQLGQIAGISPLIAQLLINRGIETAQAAQAYLNPLSQVMPAPIDEFPDLAISVEMLSEAIANQGKIAICGDYDADGMTSTALLLRALRWLGADVDYAIPSRMKDGYGINKRIVEEFAGEGVGLVLTVDNGISAHEAIARAVELGLMVIITDHHDLPPELPDADAILNPKLLPKSSPYWGLAGVGVAYVLAVSLAQEMGQLKGLTQQLLELFTLGTIADLAPLIGINRRWLKRGLGLLAKSELAGIQALIEVAGVKDEQKVLKPDDIGFKLGPRINAIGRISDPQTVIELLTTTDQGIAQELANKCEEINKKRQQLCEEIEQEAIALIEQSQLDWQEERVLVIVQADWHHGVIGIVASRLLERYGTPVFIGTYEGEEKEHIRGSARGIPEFHVFEALQACQDLLGKFGGHQAAGGFSLASDNLAALQARLKDFAHQSLQPEHIKPLVTIDAHLQLKQINDELYQQLNTLHPCGIGNRDPVFWTGNVQIVEQRIVGKGHIKLTLAQDNHQIKAIAWRQGDFFPLPSSVDIAYKLRENNWNDKKNIELELVGIRLPTDLTSSLDKVDFDFQERRYSCNLIERRNGNSIIKELKIRNSQGKFLLIQKGQKTGLLGFKRENAQEVNVTKEPYYQLIKAATRALQIN